MGQYLTIQDAAKALRSSRSHVYLLLQQGRLEPIAAEGKICVSKNSVDRYVKLKNELESIQEEMRKEYPQDVRRPPQRPESLEL
jgi:excisionase family DNA binding protein